MDCAPLNEGCINAEAHERADYLRDNVAGVEDTEAADPAKPNERGERSQRIVQDHSLIAIKASTTHDDIFSVADMLSAVPGR